MHKIKGYDYEDLEKFRRFVEALKDGDGNIKLKIKCCYDGGTGIDFDEGDFITAKNIDKLASWSIYFIDENKTYDEFVFAKPDGSMILAQDLLH